jgi:DNA primase
MRRTGSYAMTTSKLAVEQIDLLALALTDVPLRQISRNGRRGEEWVGPCPVCHAGDDRFHVWPQPPTKRPNYWCRICEATGDAIDYVRWTGRAASFRDALAYLSLRSEERGSAAPPTPPQPPTSCTPPSDAWQEQAWLVSDVARERLWTEEGAIARRWLHGRGLNTAAIARTWLGWQPTPLYLPRADWELEPGADGHTQLVIPRGIVIPYDCEGQIWRLEVRRIEESLPKRQKYRTVPGSANALYNAWTLRPGQPAVLVEGAFDAMAVAQAAGDLVGVVACGTSGARTISWLARLARCSTVLVALDADDDPAKGDRASAWWCDALKPAAYRWRPLVDDPAAMLAAGHDLRAWVLRGLEAASNAQTRS